MEKPKNYLLLWVMLTETPGAGATPYVPHRTCCAVHAWQCRTVGAEAFLQDLTADAEDKVGYDEMERFRK